MNERIADLLAQHFIAFNFLSKTAGCVQTLQRQGVRFPASNRHYENAEEGACITKEDYTDMTPNTDETGILYFEDKGSERISGDTRKEVWVGTLRLVCWLNLKLIGTQTPGALQEAVMSNLLKEIPNDGFFLGGKLHASRVLPKTPHPFTEYAYDEAKSQFLMLPFTYFSLELKYRILTMQNCPTTITLNPQAC